MVIDAKDGGIISRPRLWWFDIDWDTATKQLHSNTPWQITQTFHQTMWHLTNPIATQLQPDIQVRDRETPTVLQQNQLFHCLTTQASSNDGRPPPRSANVDDDTWRRWEDNNKQFPPWQYRPEYLTRYKDSQWQTVTPRDCQRSTNGENGRPLLSTQLLDTSISPTTTPQAHIHPQTIATLRPHHRPGLQRRTDRL